MYDNASNVSTVQQNCVFLEKIKEESCEDEPQEMVSKPGEEDQDPFKETPLNNCPPFTSNHRVHLQDKQKYLESIVVENMTTTDTKGHKRNAVTVNVDSLLKTKFVPNYINYSSNSSNAGDTYSLYSCTTCENTYATFADLLIHTKFECSQPHGVLPQEQPDDVISLANVKESDILQHIQKICTDNLGTMYSCSVCDLANLSFSQVRSHVNCFLRNGPSSHDVNCGNEVKTLLDSHRKQLQEAIEFKKYSCHICPKFYSTNKSLKEHIKKIHQNSTKCKICKKLFTNKILLKTHVIQHHRNHRYVCHICNKGFILRSSQIKHILVIHNAQPKYFRCKICYTRFYTKFSLDKHLDKNHKPGNMKFSHLCSICGKSLSSAGCLWVHEKSVHGTEPKQHTCEKCGKRFRFATVLKKHMSRHMGIKRFACPLCGKKYFDKACMLKHQVCHSEARPHACKICDMTFKRPNNLRNHEIRVHCIMPPGKTVYPCSVCGKEFISKKRELEHMNIHTGNCPFSCNLCEKSFRSSASLYTHNWKIHLKKKKNYPNSSHQFLCDKCDKSYRNMATLKQHQKKAHGLNDSEETSATSTCNKCEKSFSNKQSLRRHIDNIHQKATTSGEQQSFSCDACDKTYNNRHSLYQHKRNIHMKNKSEKHTCSTCGKTFNNKGSLYSHSRIHVKAHTCEVCNKSFSWKSKYLTHLTTHSEDKPFACPTCDKTFRRKYELEVHTRSHTGEKPYPCDVCGRGFSQSSDRNKHQTKVHARKQRK